MSSALIVCSAVTLTSSFAAVNAAPIGLVGSWGTNSSGGVLTLLVNHAAHGSQSGGYPVIRPVWGYYLADGTLVPAHDPMLDPNTSASGGVTTVEINTDVANLKGLTDSTGTRWLPVQIDVPRWAAVLYYLEAKQAGDTAHLGNISAQLTGRI